MTIALYLMVGLAVSAYALVCGHFKMKNPDNKAKVAAHMRVVFQDMDDENAVSTANVILGISVVLIWPLYVAIRVSEAIKGRP